MELKEPRENRAKRLFYNLEKQSNTIRKIIGIFNIMQLMILNL